MSSPILQSHYFSKTHGIFLNPINTLDNCYIKSVFYHERFLSARGKRQHSKPLLTDVQLEENWIAADGQPIRTGCEMRLKT